MNNKKFLLYFSALIGLYILPLILADRFYDDDLRRSVEGHFGVIFNGRIISQIYFFLITVFSTKNIYLFPLPIIIAGIFLILTGFLIYKMFTQNISPFLASLLCFLFVANPFFLQNLSYQYDSGYMGIALFFSVLSFYTVYNNPERIFLPLLMNTLTLLTYQPAIAIFTELCLFYFVVSVWDPTIKIGLRFLIRMSIITVLSFMIYYFISLPFIGSHIEIHGKMLPLNGDIAQKILSNIGQGISFMSLAFKGKDLLLLVPLVVSWIFLMVSARKFGVLSISFWIVVGFPLVLIMLVLIPVFPLQSPIIEARVFMGFSVILFFPFYGIVYLSHRYKIKSIPYIIFIPALYCLIFSYSYGNSLKTQRNFENNLLSYITEDLKGLNRIEDIHYFIFIGEVPVSPESVLIFERFPLIKTMSLMYLDNATFDFNWNIRHYPIFQKDTSILTQEQIRYPIVMQKEKTQPILKQNPLYSLKIVDDTVVIEYKKS